MHGRNSGPGSELIARIKSGDEAAFDELYLELFTPMYEYAFRLVRDAGVAEDLVQDVFQMFWGNRASYNIQGSVRVYLFSALKKRALNYRRHDRVVRRTESLHSNEESPGLGTPPQQPDAVLRSSEINEFIDHLLEEMPDERREVLLLRWRHGMGYDEIAQIVGISVSAAQAQVSRAQRALRPILKDLLG